MLNKQRKTFLKTRETHIKQIGKQASNKQEKHRFNKQGKHVLNKQGKNMLNKHGKHMLNKQTRETR